jgi:hypothetical protein
VGGETHAMVDARGSVRALHSLERVLALVEGTASRHRALEALYAAQMALHYDPRQWMPVGGISGHVLQRVREMLREWPQWPTDPDGRKRADTALADAVSGMSLQQWRQRHLPAAPAVELPLVELPQITTADAADAEADYDRLRRISTPLT